MSTNSTIKALRGETDARSSRGRFSRGNARYGVGMAPKVGKLTNIQKAAQKRLKKMRKLHG